MQLLLNQTVITRDGISLATDVYMPEGLGPWSVVLERTPYNKSAPSRSEVDRRGHRLSREEMAEAFATAGFATVFQDCRGRHGSDGVFIKYVNEAEDGYDTLQWIVEQPWCNGKIGTMGLSYAAHTQLALACLNPPGLACMVLDSGGFSNAYQCGIRQGGAFELKQATWAYRQALQSPEAEADPVLKKALEQEDIRHWFSRMPWSKGHSPLRHLPDYEDYLLQQWQNGTFGPFWQQLGIYAESSYDTLPDIPVMLMSSWYDAYVKTTLDNYAALRSRKTSPLALVMGPWLHGDRNDTFAGDVSFGPQSCFDGQVASDWLRYRIDWFTRWMKDEQAAVTQPQADTIHIFQMGGGSGSKDVNGRMEHGGQWLQSTHWPMPDSRTERLYLHAGGVLSPDEPQAAEACACLQADPHNPVPTVGGSLTSGMPVFAGGGFDQREEARFFGARGDGLPLSARHDVLVFETAPLAEDVQVAGAIKVQLYIDSDAPDTDFTVKLVDVYPASEDYPQGFALNITDGIFRCRYRHGFDKPQLLTAGEVVEITIEPFATCNLFRKGHRLRLDIAGSNFPKYDVNPNSGEPEGQARLKRIANNRVHLSARYPSHLTLNVMPAQSVDNASSGANP